MNEKEIWNDFCNKYNVDINTHYDIWQFADTNVPDEFLTLVLKGIKTSTSSGYELYFLEESNPVLPKAGDYSVILNFKNEAVCVIKTIKTMVVPFDEVKEEHAYKEGEGDRSLAYWKKVHEDFFNKEYSDYGVVFSSKSLILCEEFEVCYKV